MSKGTKTSEHRMVRVVALSDTHELHRELDLPLGDILIHAGDFTFFGKRRSQIADFDAWLGELPYRYKIVIPGNHEFALEADQQMRSVITNAVLLIDEGVEIAGLKVWGSPVTPLHGVAFGESNPAERKKHWARIPKGTDILVTHGPPYGILDVAPDSDAHEGCPQLLDAVLRLKPRLHVFGHVHGAYGILRNEHTTYVNAALFGSTGDLDKPPLILEVRTDCV
jgi:Icc-related predicted phosphoesterase